MVTIKKIGLIYFIILSIHLLNCNPADIKTHSVRMDKIMIPIMYNLSNHHFEKAYNASLLLKEEWELYKDIDFGKETGAVGFCPHKT